MVKIQYEIDGTLVDVEVTEEVALAYQEILDDEKRVFERDKKRAESSLDLMFDAGFQFADPKSNVEEIAIKEECKTELMSAIEQLSLEQQLLVKRVFFNKEKQTHIAKELGVDATSIRDRLKVIYKKLKEILQS